MNSRARSAERSHYRCPAPPVEALVEWPESFGHRFFVTVDTEEEFDWSAPFDRAQRSVTAIAAMPGAAARFRNLGASLTALIDHPVATDPAAIEHLQRAVADSGLCIGAQLHPWVTPPFEEELSEANSFAGNLPIDLEDRKLTELTGAITRNFGPPQIYRSGRYGLGPNTLNLLARLGYRIDTSVRARYDYSGEQGPDFSALGNAAFRVGAIHELPLTTVFTGALRNRGPALHRAARRVPLGIGGLSRLGLLSRVALTPEEMPVNDAVRAIDVALEEGTRILVLSFHSPSLVPGHTPYVRSTADLTAFWRWWDDVLAAFARRGVRDVPLAELLAALA